MGEHMSWTFQQINALYNARDTDKEIMVHGLLPLASSGIDAPQAKRQLRKLIKTHKSGPVLDALVCCMLARPDNPAAYLDKELAAEAGEIPADWSPCSSTLSELHGLGIDHRVVSESRSMFIQFFAALGIRNSDFSGLFCSWVGSMWNTSQAHEATYLRLLRRNGDYEALFSEPA